MLGKSTGMVGPTMTRARRNWHPMASDAWPHRSQREELGMSVATPSERFEVSRDCGRTQRELLCPAWPARPCGDRRLGHADVSLRIASERGWRHIRNACDRDALRDDELGEYELTISFVRYEQDREIAWTVGRSPEKQYGHVYDCRPDPIPDGTLIAEYYDWSGNSDTTNARVRLHVVSESALRATLGSLARTSAPSTSRPGVQYRPGSRSHRARFRILQNTANSTSGC